MEREKVSSSLRRYYEENYTAKPIKQKEKKEEPKSTSNGVCSIDMSKGTEMKDYFNYTKKYQSAEKNEEQKQHTVLMTPDKPKYTINDILEPYILDDDEIKTVGETISYTCYSDNRIADDDYKLVKDPDEKFGKANIVHIYNNDTDELYIRSPKTRSVYHILKEDVTYNQAAGKYTHMLSEPDEEDYEDDYEEYADMYDPE